MGALKGIKVIEIGTAITGPYCGQIFGDHGAEVIKIEEVNEIGHKRTPLYKEKSLHYTSVNRNKKNITLNLKTNKGREVLYRLIKESDVLITNYSVGVPERLGFGYDKISTINPKIIMTHITGFGLTGSLRYNKVFDPITQGLSGILHLTGEPEGPPSTIGVYLADHFAPLQAATGTLMALHARKRTGKGQLVDIAMLDSMVSTHAFNFSEATLNKVEHKRTGTRITYTFSGIFPTKDGYVVIAPVSDKMWDLFCETIGHDEWKTIHSIYQDMNKRLEDFDFLEEKVKEWTSQYLTEEVVCIMNKVGVPCGPISTIQDVINNPQIQEREMIISLNIPEYEEIKAPGIPIKLSETPHVPVTPPPSLNQNSYEILSKLGYLEEDIKTMVKQGVTEICEKNKIN